jgi:Tfp pilus assembly PilM family ATPase
MIKRLFIPEVIGSYYVISQRIVGFELGRNQVYATVVRAHARKRIIERWIEQVFDNDPTLSYEQRASDAIKRVLAQVGRFDKVYTSLPSSQVIFKELTVPFTNPQKIKMILPLELEPLLPFSLAEATVDSIITKSNTHQTELFAVAVKNETLQEHVGIFMQAGVVPSKVTVDVIELYGLYRQIPEYAGLQEGVVLLDLGLQSTRIAILLGQQLKAVRVLPKGMVGLARAVGERLNIEVKEALDMLVAGGLASDQEQIEPAVVEFFNEVQFTIQAFLGRIQPAPRLQQILISGFGEEIADINGMLERLLNAPCGPLLDHKLIRDAVVTTVGSRSVPSRFTVSLATALEPEITALFNLGSAYGNPLEEKLIKRQLIVAGLLMLATIGAFILYSFMTTKRLQQEITIRERETIDRLKKAFPGVPRIAKATAGSSLDTLNNEARREVAREKSIWFALSSKNRSSFLRELDELSTRIDREGLGLNLKRLGIDEDTLSLEGQVKDFEALRLLEEDLRQSRLFKAVPKLEDTRFNLKLALDTTREED